MSKVEFKLSIGYPGANRESGVLDTVDDLGLDEGEWESLSDDERYEFVTEWANDYIEYWYEDVADNDHSR